MTSTFAYTDTAHPAAVTSVADGATTDGFTYDGAGRMVSRTVDGVTTALTWDVTSSLVEWSGQGGHVLYAYDTSGQRVAQARVADANGVGTATAYVASGQVDDPNTATTNTGDSTATRYYTFGGSTVAMRTNDGNLSLMLGDEQGSTNVVMPVHVVADGNGTTAHLAPATLADAAAITRTSYTPYGELRGADNTATDRGWLGQVEDRVDGATGTGLTYLNARYYDPTTMRFISPDPLMNPGNPTTLDPYRYADNNPVVFTDASGLTPCAGTGAGETACLKSYYKGTGFYAPVATATTHTGLTPYYGTASRDTRVLRSLRAIAQIHQDQAAAPSQLQVWITPTFSTVTAGLSGLANFPKNAGSRAATLLEYEGQVAWRRIRDPRQAAYDDLTLTSVAENAVGVFQILGGGAHLVNKGKYCGSAGECLQGGLTPTDSDGDKQAITIGHTVTFPSGASIKSEWIEHEFTHVLQYEILGAVAFGVDYGAEQLWGVTFGHKSKEEAYQDQSSEQWARAVAEDPNVEPGQNPLGHWFEKSNS